MSRLTGCVVYFKGNDILPLKSTIPKSITLRGYCSHENCRTYRLQWIPTTESDAKMFQIYRTNNPKQHFTDLSRWCNGLARIDLKNDSKNLYPEDLFKKHIRNGYEFKSN